MIELKAYAKVNLFLRVYDKRRDGFHNLESVMHKISLHDTLIMESSEELQVFADHPDVPSGPDNLVYRAMAFYLEVCGVSDRYTCKIHKEIPAGAGLGGGSSDVAAVLSFLNEIHGGLKTRELHALAAKIGSDVPFFLGSSSAYVTGRGEKVQPLPDKHIGYFLLARPGGSLSTKQVYENFRREDRRDMDVGRIILDWKYIDLRRTHLVNDLEASACRIQPKIMELKRTMSQYAKAYMSGSGDTVFSIFDSMEEARRVEEQIRGQAFWSCVCPSFA